MNCIGEFGGMTKLYRLDDMITEVAQLLFPHENIRDAKKTVRNAFENAVRVGKFKVVSRNSNNKPMVVRRDFECWAAEQWPSLQASFQVPTVASMECKLPSIIMSSIGVVMPMTHENDEKFVEVSVELVKTRSRLATLEVELEALQKEAAERQAKDAETTKKKSEAGKRGGRGRWGGKPT